MVAAANARHPASPHARQAAVLLTSSAKILLQRKANKLNVETDVGLTSVFYDKIHRMLQ
jgi:hypothetical protein